MWNCLFWISAVLGLMSSLFFALIMRRCHFKKCYRMLLFRPDLIVFAVQHYWGRKFGDFWGADKQFSLVDLKKVYSLIIRSAYHIVDINNKPEQGQIEDKQVFYELAVKHSLPCVPVIDPQQLVSAPDTVDFPIFAKPRKLQWGEGVMKIESKDQPEFQNLVREGARSAFFDNFIVQHKLDNIPALSTYFPSEAPLCTARITTFIHPSNDVDKSSEVEGTRVSNVYVLECWLRVGASGALADQFENGGSTFALYADTGVVWNGTTTEKMVFGEKPFLEPTLHKAVGAANCITGHKLPFWDQCLSTVKDAHKKLAPHAFTVGWDIVFTNNGIQIMEGNLMSMVALHMGMRYGTMSLLWPDSPMVWIALSDWLRDKEGGLQYTEDMKKQKLEKVKASLQKCIAKTVKDKARLKDAVLKLKASDIEAMGKPSSSSSECLEDMQIKLMQKEGEILGLTKELGCVKDAIINCK